LADKTLFRIVKSLQDYAKLTLSHAQAEKANCHHSNAIQAAIDPCKHAEKVLAISSLLLVSLKSPRKASWLILLWEERLLSF
jgi:hypothetical protein